MFDQNNVNLAPGAIGTRPRSSATIPIAPLPAKWVASPGDAHAEITLRSMISHPPRSRPRNRNRTMKPLPNNPVQPQNPVRVHPANPWFMSAQRGSHISRFNTSIFARLISVPRWRIQDLTQNSTFNIPFLRHPYAIPTASHLENHTESHLITPILKKT